MQIEIDKLIRSKRRTIALIIERDGSFTVRAPMRAPRAAIDTFIQQKADWITRAREKIKSIKPAAERQYADGEKFLYLGSSFDLKLVEFQKHLLHFDNGFSLHRAAQAKGEQVFIRWYKARALEVISERVKQYSAQHNFTPKQLNYYRLKAVGLESD
jgi:predicted metal-dependent hydrolase